MILVYIFVFAILLVVLLIVAVGAALLRRRPPRPPQPLAPDLQPTARDPQPLGPAQWSPPSDPRQTGSEGAPWLLRPDLQPAQALALSATIALDQDWPPGLAVTAVTAGPAGYPRQDVYYVQRNIIALARGLNAAGAGQRAAALTLSAVMTSRLGRGPDAEQAMRDAAKSANQLVRSISRRSPGYSDLATTFDVVFVAVDEDRPWLHFAHVGNSSIWLQRAGAPSAKLLTESHTIDGGQLLRAVGLDADLVPDTGQVPVDVGDRIFLTTASPYFAFTTPHMDAMASTTADRPLHDAVAALAEAVNSSGAPDEVLILGAELARPGSFVA